MSIRADWCAAIRRKLFFTINKCIVKSNTSRHNKTRAKAFGVSANYYSKIKIFFAKRHKKE